VPFKSIIILRCKTMKQGMQAQAFVTISLPQNRVPELAVLLQYGIFCPVQGSQSVQAFLLAQPGLSRAYIEAKVKTIFVNGQPADQLETMVTAGDTVALSAAMPGLAGAIFRRQGLHASLRSKPGQIDTATLGKTTDNSRASSDQGYICLKLFNTIACDLAAIFFSDGVLLPARALMHYARRTSTLCSSQMPCYWNEELVEDEQLVRLLHTQTRIFLRLQADGPV